MNPELWASPSLTSFLSWITDPSGFLLDHNTWSAFQRRWSPIWIWWPSFTLTQIVLWRSSFIPWTWATVMSSFCLISPIITPLTMVPSPP